MLLKFLFFCRLDFWVFILERHSCPRVCRGAGRPLLAGAVEHFFPICKTFIKSHKHSSVSGLPLTVSTTKVQSLGPLPSAESAGARDRSDQGKLLMSRSLLSLLRQLIMAHRKVSRDLQPPGVSCRAWTKCWSFSQDLMPVP